MRRRMVRLALVAVLAAVVGGAVPAQGAGEPGVVHFTAVGDLGQTPATAAVLTGIAAQAPDLHVALGDLSYRGPGSEQSWCDFVTARVGAGFPFELLAGNHESNGQDGRINDFAACLPNQLPGVVGTYGRQFYADVPRAAPLVRFVMISPALPFDDGVWSYAKGSPRYTWTAAAIDGARAAGIPWVVVGMHEPCLSVGEYGCEVGPDIVNLLVGKKVDLVLTGHEHIYQRTKQLAQSAGCAGVVPGTYTAACVADADDDLRAGAGTVFATVGTGGQERYPVNVADAEAPYFAALSGANKGATEGLLDVRATATDLTARFVPVGGGTFTDFFAVHRGAPAPNQAPTAAFTSTASGLAVTFDGSGSRDPDGTVVSYRWTFGDGGTGTGATAQHTYAAAGTYSATLTVTDDAGATGTVTRAVTVTAAPPPPAPAGTFVTDTFARTVANGLGTADLGGAWTAVGTASNFSVSPGSGALVLRTAGTELGAYLGGTARTDTDLMLTVTPDKLPGGNGVYLDVVGRRVGANSEYRASLVLGPSGRVTAGFTALRGTAAESAIGAATQLSGVSYAAGTPLAVRLQVTGTSPTTLRLKVWPAATAEPAAWQLTATDSGAGLQTAGAVGVTAYLSSSAANAPVTVRLGNLSARPVA